MPTTARAVAISLCVLAVAICTAAVAWFASVGACSVSPPPAGAPDGVGGRTCEGTFHPVVAIVGAVAVAALAAVLLRRPLAAIALGALTAGFAAIPFTLGPVGLLVGFLLLFGGVAGWLDGRAQAAAT